MGNFLLFIFSVIVIVFFGITFLFACFLVYCGFVIFILFLYKNYNRILKYIDRYWEKINKG